MNYRSGLLTGIAATLLAGGAFAGGWWLVTGKPFGPSKPAPHTVPAEVPKPFKEDQPAVVMLKPEAEERLAIRTDAVRLRAMPRARTYGGDVVIPPGRAVVVAAPLAGTLRAAGASTTATAPTAGLTVHKGESVFELLPILDPVGRVNLLASRDMATADVKNAEETLHAAEVALKQAKTVLASGAGRQRDVEDAEAQLGVRRKALETAVERRDQLVRAVGDLERGSAAPIPVEAPLDGLVRTVSAAPGQAVPAGAALFEVVNLDHVWVRVPVYVGELPESGGDSPKLDTTAPAVVGGLAADVGGRGRVAEPEPAPPAASPAPNTRDLFYRLDNRRWVPLAALTGLAPLAADRRPTLYAPGERVAVTIRLQGEAESLVVPWSAVVIDIQGGTWVFEPTGHHTFTRRRVVVRHVVGDTAVLAGGPKPGTKVVTAGAAELFGTETGFSK